MSRNRSRSWYLQNSNPVQSPLNIWWIFFFFLVCMHISWWSCPCHLDVLELPRFCGVYELWDEGCEQCVPRYLLAASCLLQPSHVAVATLSIYRHGAVVAYPCFIILIFLCLSVYCVLWGLGLLLVKARNS